jgi:hypothetical protein
MFSLAPFYGAGNTEGKFPTILGASLTYPFGRKRAKYVIPKAAMNIPHHIGRCSCRIDSPWVDGSEKERTPAKKIRNP